MSLPAGDKPRGMDRGGVRGLMGDGEVDQWSLRPQHPSISSLCLLVVGLTPGGRWSRRGVRSLAGVTWVGSWRPGTKNKQRNHLLLIVFNECYTGVQDDTLWTVV